MLKNNAVIYVKCDPHIQNEITIEEQLKLCYDYAKNHNFNIINEYVDTSIKDGIFYDTFRKMIKDSKRRQVQTVIMFSLDIFSTRYDSAYAKYELRKNNINVLLANQEKLEIAQNYNSNFLTESIIEALIEFFDNDTIVYNSVCDGACDGAYDGAYNGISNYFSNDELENSTNNISLKNILKGFAQYYNKELNQKVINEGK